MPPVEVMHDISCHHEMSQSATECLPHPYVASCLYMTVHAMWFHRDFRADEWLLFVQGSPVAGGGRGLNLGQFFTADGKLVASAVQESLMRRLAD